MTIKTAITAIDSVWELRRKPIGWLILAAAGLVLAFSVWDQAQAGRAWVQKIDKHVDEHERDKARLEWKVDVVNERTERMDGRLERMEDALIRRGERER